MTRAKKKKKLNHDAIVDDIQKQFELLPTYVVGKTTGARPGDKYFWLCRTCTDWAYQSPASAFKAAQREHHTLQAHLESEDHKTQEALKALANETK